MNTISVRTDREVKKRCEVSLKMAKLSKHSFVCTAILLWKHSGKDPFKFLEEVTKKKKVIMTFLTLTPFLSLFFHMPHLGSFGGIVDSASILISAGTLFLRFQASSLRLDLTEDLKA
ncbi:hypothetical protein PoB_004305300 [Plakobranchus ocellatus]|uniref:Odorant receptor n=1 Tax=Plakobranchus ocellatus TaxID=259542 RepID=A0AAV4BBJ8_9GAST|nr:hypothetical protein PoB_004305300 [Plakobranchus ocellatus]